MVQKEGKTMTMTTNNNEILFEELLECSDRELNLLNLSHEEKNFGKMLENIYRNEFGDVLRIRSVNEGVDHKGYPIIQDKFYFNGIRTSPRTVVCYS
jgi:hypothetical protein